MNYLKIYCNLIRKAENRTPPEGYTENHHVFPMSIFGKNNRMVTLSGREHYIAHALLEKICIKRYGIANKKTIKMIKCHLLMKDGKRYYNSYLYEYVRKRVSNIIRGENHHNYGKSHKTETKKKISDALKMKYSKENHHMKGKLHSDETKRKIREKNKNRYVSKETKQKISSVHNKVLRFVSPSGEIIDEFTTITKFCKKHNLHRKYLINLMKGKSKTYKGWTLCNLEYDTLKSYINDL